MSKNTRGRDLRKFEAFLSGIDLDLYREKYSRIRTVELDLPKELQAIEDIYREYWDKTSCWLDYDEFYAVYYAKRAKKLLKFGKEKGFSRETFRKGLPARIYRTWSPIITQIQCGYLAENIYGTGSVSMSEELDRAGVDIRVLNGNKTLNFQVKKFSQAGVRGAKAQGKSDFPIYALEYEVPGGRYKLNGEERVPYIRWRENWQETNKVDCLPNGFVVFRRGIFNEWPPVGSRKAG